MTALDLHPPELRSEAAKLLAGMMADKIMVCPIPLQARDGTRILVETKLMHGQWRGQKALLGISHDVTQRKQAEETLQHERNLFRTVLDNLPSIIFIKDKNGRYILSNRAHQGVLGVAQESLLGKTGFDFHPARIGPAISGGGNADHAHWGTAAAEGGTGAESRAGRIPVASYQPHPVQG